MRGIQFFVSLLNLHQFVEYSTHSLVFIPEISPLTPFRAHAHLLVSRNPIAL